MTSFGAPFSYIMVRFFSPLFTRILSSFLNLLMFSRYIGVSCGFILTLGCLILMLYLFFKTCYMHNCCSEIFLRTSRTTSASWFSLSLPSGALDSGTWKRIMLHERRCLSASSWIIDSDVILLSLIAYFSLIWFNEIEAESSKREMRYIIKYLFYYFLNLKPFYVKHCFTPLISIA